MYGSPRECDHLIRQAADDACGDRILAAGGEHGRSQLTEPRGRYLPQVDRARHLERVAQAEVLGNGGLQDGARPASVGAARSGSQRRETDVGAPAPVAADRTQRQEPDLASVGRAPEAVDPGAAHHGYPPPAVGAGAQQRQRVVVDHQVGCSSPAARSSRGAWRAPRAGRRRRAGCGRSRRAGRRAGRAPRGRGRSSRRLSSTSTQPSTPRCAPSFRLPGRARAGRRSSPAARGRS